MKWPLPDMNSDLDLLRNVAAEAAQLALALRDQGLESETKLDGSAVTNGDLAVNAMLRERLLSARPGYGWISEETVEDVASRDRDRVFVVDPIDGTDAYVRGQPWWTTSIAVVEAGRPIAGVVVAPALEELYEAAIGEGARLNNSAMAPSSRTELEGCTMLANPRLLAHPAWLQPWPPMLIEMRSSVAYRIVLVASGQFDACVAPAPRYAWDLAAADLISHEAGALATDNAGRPYVYGPPTRMQHGLVCAGPGLHSVLIGWTTHIKAH